MLAKISQVTRRARGGMSLKPTMVTADTLRFGRGTLNEVLLPDIRVGVAEAVLHLRDGGLFLEQVGTNPIRVNGTPTASAQVKLGDEIEIGPYKITIVEPDGGADVAVTVELVSPLGDDFARLQRQSAIGLGRTRLSRRRVAWVSVATLLVLFLALPIAGHLLNPRPDPRSAETPRRVLPTAVDVAWNVGEISNPHKTFWRECRTCHENAFISVRDNACLTCHSSTQHHVDIARFPALTFSRQPCGGCHQEHRGSHGTILRAQVLCTDCHTNLKATASNAELRDASDFGTNHPQFRATVVADAAAGSFARVDLGPDAHPVDHPNLKFSHRDHVEPTAWPRDMRKLVCASCHKLDSGGTLMRPIAFDQDCAECHKSSLKFDVNALDRAVPHGDAMAAQRTIADFYARVALEGGADEPAAPASVRRRPGTPLTEPERLEALAWAKQRATAVRAFVFDDLRGCGTCHEVDRSGPDFKIAPVRLQTQFLPKAQFNHARHTTVACESCHDARQSTSSGDLLIPGIETCRGCHGGEAAASKVRSTCIACHSFHKPGTGPMRPQTASSKN